MREEIGSLVHRIITAGLDLKERLARGDAPDLDKEQAKLKGMLGDADARRFPEFAGEASVQTLFGGNSMSAAGRTAGESFLGMRYALACWLDEIFILDFPDTDWSREWNERKLEVDLFASSERAWRFWDQSRKAETRSADALEVYFLCVMLGFRGEFRDQPERLHNWRAATHALIAKTQGAEWPAPDSIDPPTFVPPLRGRDMLQRMVMVCGAVVLLLILIGSFFVISRLTQ